MLLVKYSGAHDLNNENSSQCAYLGAQWATSFFSIQVGSLEEKVNRANRNSQISLFFTEKKLCWRWLLRCAAALGFLYVVSVFLSVDLGTAHQGKDSVCRVCPWSLPCLLLYHSFFLLRSLLLSGILFGKGHLSQFELQPSHELCLKVGQFLMLSFTKNGRLIGVLCS